MFSDTDNGMIDRVVSSETKLFVIDKVIFDQVRVDPTIYGFFIDLTEDWQKRDGPVINPLGPRVAQKQQNFMEL